MSGKLRASHILVKHQGSRRPASWKDPSGEEIQKRTKQDAEKILNGLREVSASNSQLSHSVLTQPQEIVSESKSFAGVATEMSDCGSAQDGGKTLCNSGTRANHSSQFQVNWLGRDHCFSHYLQIHTAIALCSFLL